MKRAVAAALVGLVGCEPQTLLPPPVPPKIAPDVAPVAAVPGRGQVAIGADEPSTVTQLVGSTTIYIDDGSGTGATTPFETPVYRTVCGVTPCVANLDFGEQELRLVSTRDPDHAGGGTVTVGRQPSAFNFALGHNRPTPHLVGGLAATVGGTTAVLGGVFMVAFSQPPAGSSGPRDHALATAGLITLGVGAALTVLGIHFLADGGTTQAGTGVQWTPQRSGESRRAAD